MFKIGDEKIVEGLICDGVNLFNLLNFFYFFMGCFFLKMYFQLWIKYWGKNVY